MKSIKGANEDQTREHMSSLILAAQHIIYESSRAEKLLRMLSTKTGGVMAVHTVLAGIDQTKPLEKEEAVLLAPVVLMLLIDLGRITYGKSPKPEQIQAMQKRVMQDASESYAISKKPKQPAQPGLLEAA